MTSNSYFLHLFLLITFVLSTQATNPLQGKSFYVDPSFRKNIDGTLQNISPNETDSDKIKRNLGIARDSSTAQWLNSAAKVQPNSTTPGSMNAILTDASKQTPVPLVLFVINNLPNRDCGSNIMKSEICCTTGPDNQCDFSAPGDCGLGLQAYRSYIDNIATIVNSFKATVPMAFVVEPDAVGAMVTDLGKPRCGNPATQAAYKEGVTYAINTLTQHCGDSVTLYLDLAHGGWLGFDGNAQATAKLVQSWNVLDKIRGFSTNVANYQPIGQACPAASYCIPGLNNQTSHPCCADPCGLETRKNPANNELNYALLMQTYFPGKYFIIDTGRSGAPNARTDCSKWCNIRKAGFGIAPTTQTPLPLIDAYMWIQTPGASTGCTLTLPNWSTCPTYDDQCGSQDSIGSAPNDPRMPEAGGFSEYQLKLLAQNANFAV